jgi:hypothetical protein
VLGVNTFLGKGSKERPKTPQKCFCKASMSKTNYKSRQNFRVIFLIAFFCVSQFSAMGVQKHYKKLFVKMSCRKVFAQKKGKSKTVFLDFVLSRFLAFLGEESPKNTISH